ncbi:YrhC family protein [Bacillus sp. 2205SS5-2]|uniref:YrhC family protein n=1 Tax=Bacillus sp. 2205SS5-2 TaxID=3109031 RepID=UPI0030043B92
MKKRLNEKIIDYKRFGFTLVALSVFLYLGVVLPTMGKTTIKIYTLMTFTTIFLSLSFYFFFQAILIKKQLAKLENERPFS